MQVGNIKLLGELDATEGTISGAGGGDVSGPGSSTSGNLSSFADASGKVLQDSTVGASAVSSHLSSTSNPHSVTASQAGAVATSGDETVAGVKTFSSFPVTPSSAPTTDYQASNRKFVTDNCDVGIMNGRLTLESGVPVSTSGQTAKTTLYFTPYNGNRIALYDGSNWKLHTLTEKSLDISGYTASKPYDIFIYDNSGTLTIEGVIWTNDTTRATALATQDGVYVQNGATTKRYIGTIRITATTGQCEDSATKRFVWNMYNREFRYGTSYNSNSSWSYTTGTWREYNNGTGQVKFEFVLGQSSNDFMIYFNGTISAADEACYIGASMDAVTGTPNFWYQKWTADELLQQNLNSSMPYIPAAGYHYITQMEYGAAGVTVAGGTSRNFAIKIKQ